MGDVSSVGSMQAGPVYSGNEYAGGDAQVVQQSQPQTQAAAHTAPAPQASAFAHNAPTPQADILEGQSDDEIEKLMEKPIKQANETLRHSDRLIERSVHKVTKTLMYVVKDTKTNEVIAEYPPKKIQDMIAKMWELAGLFVDERA